MNLTPKQVKEQGLPGNPRDMLLKRNNPEPVINPKPRIHLGYIEEYYHAGKDLSQFGKYLGHRQATEQAQPLGTENRLIVMLPEPIVLNRTWSKVNTLPKGSRVIRIVWPLQGREIN